jgi:regulator-associated protein of mTOR
MTAITAQPNGARRAQYNHQRHSPHSSNGQSSHHSRTGSYPASPAGQIHRQEPPVQNGASPMMNPRPALSNVPVQRGTEEDSASTSDPDAGSSARDSSSGPSNARRLRHRRLSFQGRPTSSPAPEYSSQDESEMDKRRRKPRPLFQRSKSDFGPRGEDQNSTAEEETQDWGARHGFEDHYASEEYVSQLANVSQPFTTIRTLLCYRSMKDNFCG